MGVFISVQRALLLALTLAAAAIGVTVPGRSDAVTVARDLRICVDSVPGGADLQDARVRIERVMRADVLTHPRFRVAGYDPARWSVTVGCPTAPALLASGRAYPKNGGVPGRVAVTAQPSGYRAFVFIVPAGDIDRMFGRLPFRVAPQEVTCVADSCGEVSTALYVSPATVAASDAPAGRQELAAGLVRAIGLEPPVPLGEQSGPQRK